jgi:hypothetical protein
MPRTRLLVFVLLTSILAACSSSATAPQSPRSHPSERALRDSIPCDTTSLSGYTNPSGHC